MTFRGLIDPSGSPFDNSVSFFFFLQVVLINAVKDVAKALAELISATKCAAGKAADDPSMYQLKSAAKVSGGEKAPFRGQKWAGVHDTASLHFIHHGEASLSELLGNIFLNCPSRCAGACLWLKPKTTSL